MMFKTIQAAGVQTKICTPEVRLAPLSHQAQAFPMAHKGRNLLWDVL